MATDQPTHLQRRTGKITDYVDWLNRMIGASERAFENTGDIRFEGARKAYSDALRALSKYPLMKASGEHMRQSNGSPE